MPRKVLGQVDPEIPEIEQPKVNYDGTSTTSSMFQDNSLPPQVVHRVVNVAPELEVITPKEDRKTFMGGKWYQLKRGVQMAVTPEIKAQLAASRIIMEVEDDE